ncbi:MAG: class I SAM-dependent methyltransferase [Mariniphaga sp.]
MRSFLFSSKKRYKINGFPDMRSMGLGIMLVFLWGLEINAQHRDVPFVPTPYETVEEMLKLANVGPGDYVIDLGSGDGRIVIAAGERGAYGHGVDIDPKRINEARQNAAKAGVDDKVMFIEGNLFETDFSKATVVTMYLLNSVNMRLRPTMLEKLKPGTRVVSYYFNMSDWEPDKQILINNSDVYYWVIPAKVSGNWNWKNGDKEFNMKVNQVFQKIKPELTSGDSSLEISNPSLEGDKIWFTAENPLDKTRYVYHGRVNGNNIIGTVQIRNGENSSIETWTASLTR